jgi:hypothetical protein|tara:strand:+ start:406 stop:849 length:444 start_codon:yes stop_codon:yes gene_type:complete
MKYQYNDGGRSQYFKGDAGDCVVRAIAIASGLNYKKVYDDLYKLNAEYAISKDTKVARRLRNKSATPRNGNYKKVYHDYILSLGFKWTPTMLVGQGCKVHLKADELPSGAFIARVSKHLCAVIDGVIQDTFDPSRGGKRCVYGYYQK